MDWKRCGTIIALCILLAALSWAVFGQTLSFGFVNLDDADYLLKNRHVAGGFTGEGIRWSFTHVRASNWHPLTWISHMLDCQWFGLHPRGHHLTNVVLHTTSAILLFLVLRAMTGALWRSAFVAAVFAIHPLRVESVAWVSERKDVLSGLFFILTLAAYARYARRPRSTVKYLLVVALFALALLAKPMVVTLPFVLLLLDFWPLRRLTYSHEQASAARWPILREKLPLLALAAASSGATLYAQRGAMHPFSSVSLTLRLGNACQATVDYLRMMVWPRDLAVLYPLLPSAVTLWSTLLSLMLLGLISAAVARARQRPYLVVGWLWYLVMLVPVVGVVQVGDQARADRYTYLPQIGLYLALTWGAADLLTLRRHGRLVLGTAGVIIILAFAFCAHTQASYWQNSERLWRHAIAHTAPNSIAHVNLGQALYDSGDGSAAVAEYETALQIDPAQPRAHSALGVTLLELGQSDASIFHLNQALRLAPAFAEAHYNLGNAFLQIGDGRGAREHYNAALESDPEDLEAANNLAWLLATSSDDAVRDGPRAIALAERADALTHGTSALVAATLGAAYANSGRFAEASEAARRALAIALAEDNSARADSIRRQLVQYGARQPLRDQR
ncbi:MAG: tetratricopeptide repeat protein [Chthoniobacterales bacterium]